MGNTCATCPSTLSGSIAAAAAANATAIMVELVMDDLLVVVLTVAGVLAIMMEVLDIIDDGMMVRPRKPLQRRC